MLVTYITKKENTIFIIVFDAVKQNGIFYKISILINMKQMHIC